MKKNIFIQLLFIGIIGANLSLSAQGMKRKIADKYFSNLDYYKASLIYDELAKKNLKDLQFKKAELNVELIRRAAESNFYASNFNQAKKWYSRLDEENYLSEEDYLKFIDVLSLNREYSKVDAIVEKLYTAQNPVDRIHKLFTNKGRRNELLLDSSLYKVTSMPFNTGYGDFAPAYFNGRISFVSARRNTGFVNRKFLWNNSNYLDLYVAEKNNGNTYSKNAKILSGDFQSKPHDGPAFFTRDNQLAVITQNFSSKQPAGSQINLKLIFLRKNEKGSWLYDKDFEYNNSDYSIGHASISDDGRYMYFASNMPGGFGGTDIWKSENLNGSWGKPVNLGETVNSTGDELFPFIFQNEKLYFASNGHFGLGGLDLFVTELTSEVPSIPENLLYPINSPYDDFAMIVDSSDGSGLFSSSRIDGIDRIYSVSWDLPEFNLEGVVVFDDGKLTPMGNTTILIETSEDHTVDTLLTDPSGKFTTPLKRNRSYIIKANRVKYSLVEQAQVTTNRKRKSENFSVQLVLHQLTIQLTTLLVDRATGTPLTNSKVILKNKTTGKTIEGQTDIDGSLKMEVETDCEFEVQGHSHGYIENMGMISTSNQQGKTDVQITIPLEKIQAGEVFVVNHIYYDFNSFVLREESKVELDKLATFLIENNVKVELSSHTDARGSDKENLKLSQRRAQSCVDYLITKGVKKEHIIAKGYGESKLVNQCGNNIDCSDEEHQKNRRTEVKILKVL